MRKEKGANSGNLTASPTCFTVSAMSTIKNDGWMTIRLDELSRDQLQRLADENDRSLAAEVRRAIRRYLEAAEAEAAA